MQGQTSADWMPTPAGPASRIACPLVGEHGADLGENPAEPPPSRAAPSSDGLQRAMLLR